MGKSRGRGRGRGRGGRGRGGGGDDDSEEEYEQVRGGQSATVGMLPPSDSESEEESGDEAAKKDDKKEAKEKPAKAGGQSSTAGMLPPSGSDEDEESESESEDEAPLPEYLAAPSQPRRKKQPETPERTPEEIAKDLERLELIRKRREDDRLKRIKDEGWDRYQPISDTNRPPGHVPSDHPSKNKE